MPLSHDPQLDPSDIKLLRLFRKIVDCGGFAGAQAELNVSASTISSQMSTLESRLGMRLCDRGRVGFRVTDKGWRVYASAPGTSWSGPTTPAARANLSPPSSTSYRATTSPTASC